ncbi:hypothetical protein D4L85_02835 [Chryseolinea soli]|uniref:Uncharacterized protein n=1 Tax=Chryseolinea soli TaxID=2321403 RepID=A0A385SF65_9BACT|nr:hypothetical protein D4L85_02835 [Chryseolinea soli]
MVRWVMQWFGMVIDIPLIPGSTSEKLLRSRAIFEKGFWVMFQRLFKSMQEYFILHSIIISR